MAEAVLMPKSGISVETCIVGSWKKNVGDPVQIGEVLFDYETDKAAFECESTAGGTLLEIFFNEGDEVEVLKPVCAIGVAGEDVSAIRAGSGAAPAPVAQVAAPVLSEPVPMAQTVAPIPTVAPVQQVAPSVSASTPVVQPVPVSTPAPAVSLVAVNKGMAPVSPRAKNFANGLGIDPNAASPSGPNGRVIERDIAELSASGAAKAPAPVQLVPAPVPAQPPQTASPVPTPAAQPIAAPATVQSPAAPAPQAQPQAPVTPAPAPAQPGRDTGMSAVADALKSDMALAQGASKVNYTDTKLSKIRSVIADSMTASLRDTAQLTHLHSFEATEVRAVRKAFKSCGIPRIEGVSIGDMVLYAVIKTLVEFPYMNAHLVDGKIMRVFDDVNLGVAVDTPRGLIVPTIFEANKKSLTEISMEVKKLAAEARSGSISPDKLSGGTFTVSNLGATGVEVFTPILNPPQVGIFGVCGVTTKMKATDDGPETYPAIGMALTYDHRAVDGAPASRFAQAVCAKLAKFSLLLDV